MGFLRWFSKVAGGPVDVDETNPLPTSAGAGSNVDLGAKDDAAATTDAGTFSLISLFKRLLEKVTAGLVVGGTLGSVAKEITRPADATAYAAKDVIAAASVAINGATNASPIVVTAAAHGLETGDRVTIASVGGNTAANGSFTVTVLSSSTFSLDGSVGNGAYTSGGVIWKLLKFANLLRVAAGGGYLVKASALTDLKTCTARIRLHLYHTQPDPIADNSPFLLLYANESKRIGYVDFPAMATEDATNSTGAGALVTPNTSGGNLPMSVIAAAASRTIYGIPETLDAFTPASGQKLTFRVEPDLY